jgi:hypothetical protein
MARELEDVALKDVDPEFAGKLKQMRKEFLGDLVQDALSLFLGPVATATRVSQPHAIGRYLGQVLKHWENLNPISRPAQVTVIKELMDLAQKQFSRIKGVDFDPGLRSLGTYHLETKRMRFSEFPGTGTTYHEFTHPMQETDEFLRNLWGLMQRESKAQLGGSFPWRRDPMEMQAEDMMERLLRTPRSKRAAAMEKFYKPTRAKALKGTREFLGEDVWKAFVKELTGLGIYE